MTPAQFDVIAHFISQGGPVETAARLVLVDGALPSEAARQTECSPASVSNATKRYREAYARIDGAWSEISAELEDMRIKYNDYFIVTVMELM